MLLFKAIYNWYISQKKEKPQYIAVSKVRMFIETSAKHRLTHSPYTTKRARIRYTMLGTTFKCQDVQPTISAYIKCQDVQHTISGYIKCQGV